MCRFNIEFAKSRGEPTEGIAHGRITIGSFSEVFEASLEFWTEDDYKRHWNSAIRRTTEGNVKSCLITSITNPQTANFLFWWPVYRDGDQAVFQNQVLFLHESRASFNPAEPYDFVPDRETLSEDGAPVSEWRVPLACFEDYLSGQE